VVEKCSLERLGAGEWFSSMIYFPTTTPLLELFTLPDKFMINLSYNDYIINIFLGCQEVFSFLIFMGLAQLGA
jgi:hypothetical protein